MTTDDPRLLFAREILRRIDVSIELTQLARLVVEMAEQYETWQPIETAPKMQTILLFAVSDIGDDGEVKNWKMATGYWHTGFEDALDKARGNTPWCWDGERVKVYELHPTHWMPLPRQPSADDLGKGIV